MDSRRIIRTYLLIVLLFNLSASLIWGINTLFLLDAGLNIFEVFIANAVFTAGMVLCEVPTGVVADTRGRRLSFLFSTAVLLVGTLAYVGVAAIEGGVVLFSLAGLILGLGYTFYSGAVEAWLVDALRGSGYEEELDRVFARGHMVFGASMLVGTVGGGLLGTLDLSLPYVVRSGLLALAFLVGWRAMHDIGFAPRALRWRGVSAEMRKVASEGLTYGWNRPSVRVLMLVSFVGSGFFSWAWYAWQPYFLELWGSPAVWLSGLIAALFALSTILGNTLVGRVVRPGTRRTTILIAAAAISTVAVVGVGAIREFWISVPLFLVTAVLFGLTGPIRQSYLHSVIPSAQRATIVSLDSLVGGVGSVGGQAGLGYLSQVRSIPDGFVLGGMFTILAVPLYARLRALGEKADRVTAKEEVAPADVAGVPVMEVAEAGE